MYTIERLPGHNVFSPEPVVSSLPPDAVSTDNKVVAHRMGFGSDPAEELHRYDTT